MLAFRFLFFRISHYLLLMNHPLDEFYLNKEEPHRSCFLALREVFAHCHELITQEWKYKLPFFYLNGKAFCYLWQDKKTKEPYIGFVDGAHLKNPFLEQGNRKMMKILPINPNEELPFELLEEVIAEALAFKLPRVMK